MAVTATTRAAFRKQLARLSQTQTQVTPSQAALLAHPRAAAAVLGRLGRVNGHATGPAAGNAVVTSDARGQAAAQPGKGTGTGPANASPYPQREVLTAPSQLLARARTEAYQNGRLIARDRHIAAYRGHTSSSAAEQATGGTPNPEAAGAARPGYRMLNRTLSWQQGTDSTAQLDNTAPKPTTDAAGRAFPLGTQGDPWSQKYGGTPGLANHRAYGTRGGPGAGAPPPTVVALPGGPARPGTLLAKGSPQDGPQKIPGGPAWGLHSRTAEPAKLTQGSQRVRFSQVRPPQVNRPLNSKVAGQSYDQQVVHLDGSQAVKLPKAPAGRQPGINGRFRR